ncbi:MAG: hypothetical protein WAK16_12265 [Candidatus Cybelea sp.]
MSERVAYWVFSLALSAGITIAVGRNFVTEHGRRVIPILLITALCAGLLLGWALDGYIGYVRASAEMR